MGKGRKGVGRGRGWSENGRDFGEGEPTDGSQSCLHIGIA